MITSLSYRARKSSQKTGHFLLVLAMALMVCTPAHAVHKEDPGSPAKKKGPGPTGPAKTPGTAPAIPSFDDLFSGDPGGPGYDETSILLNVQRIGNTEMAAVIKGKTVYLPIVELFRYLKIKVETTPGFDSVTGYFINPETRYCIDNNRFQIRYQNKVLQLEPSDLIQTETNLYLRADYFRVFGLNSSFSFTSLTVQMSASVELPAIRELQLAQLHRNLSRLRGDVVADTFIQRDYPRFRFGALDWTLNTTQQNNGISDVRAGVALGSMLAGGELNLSLNYSSMMGLDKRQQFYQWRYVNNNNELLRQFSVGRIYARTTATILDPVLGVQVTNAPTTYRKSAGSYRLSRFTEPGWTVELYVNNVLVDFTKADASGFFSFDVPLVYGSSSIRLRYYGPYGEERNWEDNIIMPFNFLPKKEFEYTVSAGLVQDSLNSRLARASLSYGVSRIMTVSAGNEYLSSVKSGSNMPFATLSLRPISNLLMIADYVHSVKGSVMLSYRLPGNGQIELDWTKYDPSQRALMYNYLEERKLSFSIPFSHKRFSGMTRLLLNQILISQYTKYDRAEWLVSAAYKNVSVNLNTYMISAGAQDPPQFNPYIYTNLSMALRVWKGLTLMPEAQYSFKDQRILSAKCVVEQYLLNRGYINFSIEQNLMNNGFGMSAGIRYDLSGARVGVAASRYNDIYTLTATASGSMVFDPRSHYTGLSNRTSVGRGGISITPFLDLNYNGVRDAGEPKVQGLHASINSGHVKYSSRDTTIRVVDLEPYTNYFLDLSQNTFENINWQIRKKTMNVAVSPNELHQINVPVEVMNEVSGTVYLRDSLGRRHIGRMEVEIRRADGSLVTSIQSEGDGYFSYMGLHPGDYFLGINEKQLRKLNMKGPAVRKIHIKSSGEGVFVDDQNLEISR
ncbi:MAG: hypothetical protein JST27_03245 [Bacteroidetes bacterium]|nr:hypothetical protein [Bacteroidota bacterium]